MIIKKVDFITSSSSISQCPRPVIPEYGFTGRSNVGKSSLINYLTNHSRLAFTSGKPGRTQTINHYLVDEQWYLVDLPGYGYAKTSKKQRDSMATLIEDYTLHRVSLACLFVLIDARHKPMKIDLDFIHWLGVSQVPLGIVFTKTDKAKKAPLENNIRAFQQRMLEHWEETPPFFLTSAVQKKGKAELLEFIAQVNAEFSKP